MPTLRAPTPEELQAFDAHGVDTTRLPEKLLFPDAPAQGMSAIQAALAQLKSKAGGIIGSGAGVLGTGALIAEIAGAPETLGASLLAIPPTMAAAYGVGAAGQKLQNTLQGDELTQRLAAEAAQGQQAHPLISGATDLAANALASGGAFSPTTPFRALMGDTKALGNVAMQAGVMPAAGAAQQYLTQGTLPSLGEMGQQALGGAMFAKASRLGEWANRLPSGEPKGESNQKDNPDADTTVDTGPVSPFTAKENGAYAIGTKGLRKLYEQLVPKPTLPKGVATTPEHEMALTAWANKMSDTPYDQMRQELHQEFLKKQAEPAPEPLQMAKEESPAIVPESKPTVTDTTGAVSPTIEPKVESQPKEDVAKLETEEALPVGDGEKVTPTPTPIVEPPKAETTTAPLAANAESPQVIQSGNKVDPKDSADLARLMSERAKMHQEGTHITEQGLSPEYLKNWKDTEAIKKKYKDLAFNPDGSIMKSASGENEKADLTDQTPRHVVDHIESGKGTTGSVMRLLAGSQSKYAQAAKWLWENMDKKSRAVKWSPSTPFIETSVYRMPNHVEGEGVTMHSLQVDHVPTVIEEAMHSMLSAKLPEEFSRLRGKQLNQALLKFASENPNHPISALAKDYIETAKHLGIHEELFGVDEPFRRLNGIAGDSNKAAKMGLPHGYAMGDFHEFLAHAFKNKDFQTLLNKIDVGGGRTMWQRLIDSISEALGIPVNQRSMLDHVLRQSAELIRQDRPEMVDNARGLADNRSANAEPITEEQRALAAHANRSRAVNRDLEPTNSRDLGAFGKVFGSVLDRVRAINHPGAKPLADAEQRALVEEQRLIGKYGNAAQESGNKLPASQYNTINDAVEAYRVNGVEPKGLSKEGQEFFNIAKNLIDTIGKERIANNVPIEESTGNYRTMIQKKNYWPTMSNQKVEDMLRKNEDFGGIQKAKDDYVKYQTQTLGYSRPKSEAKWNNFKLSIQGNTKGKGVSRQDWFNAIRKAQGDPLPPSMREQNPVKNIVRYLDRASTAMAHYTKVESDPKAMAALGEKKDGWGKDIPQYEDGGLAGNDLVKAAVAQFHTTPKDQTEHLEHGLSSVATQMFVQGPPLQAHVVISNAIKTILQCLQGAGYYHGIRAVGSAMTNLRNGWIHSVEGGLVKLPAIQTRDMLDSSLSTHQRMGGVAKLIRDVSTFGGLTTKANAAFMQAAFEHSLPSLVNRANAGDRTAQTMMKRWDVDYQVGKRYSPEEIKQFASVAASYVHGTGDIRQMPSWMMKEGEISGFMQLAHWSTAQTNNFLHDVWLPAKRGNIQPLVLGMFGSAVGGLVIKELREKMQGKKGQIPSLGEIAASEKGLEGNGGLLMYNAIAAMQYAGFGGLFSQVAKWPFDTAYKNNPQGFTFPLDELASDVISTANQVSTALANDPNVNYVDLAAAVAQHTLGSNIKLASIALNQGINNGLITGYPAEKKQLADKLGELRRFDMVTGLPYNEVDSGSNPYMNLEQKYFKMEQDPQKAVAMLPQLISSIMEKYHDNPDVMMEKIKALKQNSYSTFPSMEQTPISFYKYLGYLQREEGSDKAQEALQDFLKHKVINEAKSSVVP